MAQSLEELSSIYSEASELGLTSLGVAQPHSLQHAPGSGGGGRGGIQQQHGQLMSRMMLADQHQHQHQQAHTTAASSSSHHAAVMRPASAVASTVVIADAGVVTTEQQQQQQLSAASEVDLGPGQRGERGGVQGGEEEAAGAGVGELVMEECVETEEDEGDTMDGREMDYDSDQVSILIHKSNKLASLLFNLVISKQQCNSSTTCMYLGRYYYSC